MADSEDDELDNLHLLDTALENSLSFAECFRNYESVEQFLLRDKYISVRGTNITSEADLEELDFKSDIDGVTIVWKSIGDSFLSKFRHLDLLPVGIFGLKKLFPVLKKHLKLSMYSDNSLRVLKEAVGTQLIYDGQWETWLGILPDFREASSYPHDLQKKLVVQFMGRLRFNFQLELKKMWFRGEALHTLAKNNLNDAKRVFVLPGDEANILKSFENALQNTELTELPNFRKIVFSFRFGDKWSGLVPLPIADERAVEEICVHVGHAISSRTMDLFWSRQGIKEVTGPRCQVISAFSFGECANFQTSLDGRDLSISALLRDVCPEDIRFAQMYSDLPHRYPTTRVHPISASILIVKGIQSTPSERSLYKDASKYLSEIESNFFQCRDGVCRLEFVVSLKHIRKEIDAANLIRQDKLEQLLATYSMIVPFMKGFNIIYRLRSVGLHLHRELFEAFETKKGTGDIDSVWKTFQCELAVEKLLWGHPMAGTSRIYSINLGPGLEYPSRSRTDRMGFLSLENYFSCCIDGTTLPPLCLYTKNITAQRRIESASGFVNLIGCSETVIGKKLLMTLLKEFHSFGNLFLTLDHFTMLLKVAHGNANKKIVGGITINELTQRLMSVRKGKWPMVFVVLRNFLQNLKVKVESSIEKGINSLCLGYFPAFRSHDASRNAVMCWEYKYGYWSIVDISGRDNGSIDVERVHAVVISSMEKLKLCHSSLYRENQFPWIKPVWEKLAEQQLTEVDLIKVLVFVSCLALIQLGRYVDYQKIVSVERKLPVSQSSLKILQIQSKFQVPFVNTVKLYRLHPSIPIKLDKKRSVEDTSNIRKNAHMVEENVPKSDGNVDQPYRIGDYELSVRTTTESEESQIKHKPSSGCNSVWTSVELGLLNESDSTNPQWTMFKKWQFYQERCREMQIPDRSLEAFKVKLKRIKKKNK